MSPQNLAATAPGHRCSVQPPGCLYSTPEMLIPTRQKLLDKNNFKLLIKYLVAGEQRGRKGEEATLSLLHSLQTGQQETGSTSFSLSAQPSPLPLGRALFSISNGCGKITSKTGLCRAFVEEKLLKGTKPPIEQALFINVEWFLPFGRTRLFQRPHWPVFMWF